MQGAWSGSRSGRQRAGETPWVIPEGLLEDKAVGGRSVKAFRRFVVWYLEENETHEGRVVQAGLTHPSEVDTLIAGSKALKPGPFCWSLLRIGRWSGGNGKRAATGENPERLCGVAKPLKGKPWTWLWGEIDPQGMWWSKPSRAGGTPRTERSVELGALRGRWTPQADTAMRERVTP